MKTESYNPSQIEVSFVKAIEALKKEIDDKMDNISIEKITSDVKMDNPIITLHMTDKDDDKHELVIRVIQRSDELIQ